MTQKMVNSEKSTLITDSELNKKVCLIISCNNIYLIIAAFTVLYSVYSTMHLYIIKKAEKLPFMDIYRGGGQNHKN